MISIPIIMLGLVLCIAPIQVSSWSDQRPVLGELVKADEQGVHVRSADSPVPVLIPWFDLKQIEPPVAAAGSYAPLADRAWRAHSRAQRGDFDGALPLYESMRDAYLWQLGPQSMDVSAGLKRCLLSRGLRDQAIEPALSWFASAGMWVASAAESDPGVDAKTMLHIDLPPIRPVGTEHRPLGDLTESPNLTDRERLLHAYYRLVFERQHHGEELIDRIEQLKRSIRARDAGIVLMEQVAFAQAHPEQAKRSEAQDALRRRTQTQQDGWIEVWSRLALGAALLHDPDQLRRDGGVIEMLHVVVRLHAIDPNLTMLAAQLAAEHLNATNRAVWGTQILHDARTHLTNPNAIQEYQSHD